MCKSCDVKAKNGSEITVKDLDEVWEEAHQFAEELRKFLKYIGAKPVIGIIGFKLAEEAMVLHREDRHGPYLTEETNKEVCKRARMDVAASKMKATQNVPAGKQ